MAKRGRKIPEVLTIEEQKTFLDVFNTRYPTQLRNKAMIRLMLTTGLRLSEVINLKWQHINFRAGKLKVVEGKGRKDRILWVGDQTLNLLSNWREKQIKKLEEKEKKNQSGLVFTSLTGNQLNPVNVRKMIYNYAEKAEIQEEVTKHYRDKVGKELEETYQEKKVSPHTLRHTYATDLLRECHNLEKVRKALGHTDISTTQIYTHLVDEELEEDMKALDNKFDS
ncbi:integrase/recombinase XerD [Orenia metallireducens]|jgi:integrase/recombinase XerD|uniref:Integrase/recombinase XerD n=1 Tax=Orenia metallireducens TaxID=1413210 RepID=A0A285IHT9_9FIRM|nr:tyrosine-type recombinase/integrase [Orenia metallireducens]SNY47357.1 integrase/recombinase XerD [Orenia metallireducens]